MDTPLFGDSASDFFTQGGPTSGHRPWEAADTSSTADYPEAAAVTKVRLTFEEGPRLERVVAGEASLVVMAVEEKPGLRLSWSTQS